MYSFYCAPSPQLSSLDKVRRTLASLFKQRSGAHEEEFLSLTYLLGAAPGILFESGGMSIYLGNVGIPSPKESSIIVNLLFEEQVVLLRFFILPEIFISRIKCNAYVK